VLILFLLTELRKIIWRRFEYLSKKEQVDGVAVCSGNEEKTGNRNEMPNNG
jgi:hypothetical protein